MKGGTHKSVVASNSMLLKPNQMFENFLMVFGFEAFPEFL
jgi:hypothetical protein